MTEIFGRGAAGVLLGTRFAAREESLAHEVYKQALIEAEAGSTVRTELFDVGWEHAPHRSLRNSTFAAWETADRPEPGRRPGEDDTVYRWRGTGFPRYSVMPPVEGMMGDLLAGVMYCGTGVAKIRDVQPAQRILSELISMM